MRMTLQVAVSVALLSVTPSMSQAATITISAFDTATPRISSGTDHWNDNLLRSYNSGSTHIDGFMAFDLSAIPDTAIIQTLTLTTYGYGYGPEGTPELRIYRSSHDGWHRGGSGFPSVLNEILTPIDSGPFPTGAGVPYLWSLDDSAATWSGDLLDDQLTLVIRNENTFTYNFAYFLGSDNPATAPSLAIQFSTGSAVPEPSTLTMLGIGTVAIAGATRRRRRAGPRTK